MSNQALQCFTINQGNVSSLCKALRFCCEDAGRNDICTRRPNGCHGPKQFPNYGHTHFGCTPLFALDQI